MKSHFMTTSKPIDKNIMTKISIRSLNVLLVGICLLASIFAIGYLQNQLHLEPCPLCIFQRIGLWVMGIFAALLALLNPKNLILRFSLWLGGMAGTLWGLGVAARHVWLQNLPADQVPACGPGLNYWVETLPLMKVFEQVFKGSGECASIDWTLFGLTIPMQTLILFLVIFIIQIVILLKIIKKST